MVVPFSFIGAWLTSFAKVLTLGMRKLNRKKCIYDRREKKD